ncbi:MAG: hypothetical protein GY832_05815 [Chloroflexi bacterium]|nr:hypothetical protein [Chloroflexota bacterium]
MAKRGRPRLEQPPIVVNLKLRLYVGMDDDLIAFFDAIPPGFRAGKVKQALQSGATTVDLADLPDDDEITDALDALVF